MPDTLKARLVGGRAVLFRDQAPALPAPPAAQERSRLMLPTPADAGFGTHFTVDGRDPRLPSPGVITNLTRQAARRIQRGKGPRCHRCPGKVTVAAQAVFDDGHEAHRGCSEGRNAVLEQAATEMAAEDARARAERFGLAVDSGAELWVPPRRPRPPEPELDLSKGIVLSPS